MIRKTLFAVLLLLPLINGCSKPEVKPVVTQITTVAIDKPKLNLPSLSKLDMDAFSWKAFVDKDKVYYGLSDADFDKYKIDMAKILQQIEERNSIIDSYKSYYEGVK